MFAANSYLILPLNCQRLKLYLAEALCRCCASHLGIWGSLRQQSSHLSHVCSLILAVFVFSVTLSTCLVCLFYLFGAFLYTSCTDVELHLACERGGQRSEPGIIYRRWKDLCWSFQLWAADGKCSLPPALSHFFSFGLVCSCCSAGLFDCAVMRFFSLHKYPSCDHGMNLNTWTR